MNTLESCNISSPFGVIEECAKFNIDEIDVPYTMTDITTVSREYTLAFWVKSEHSGVLTVGGSTCPTDNVWNRHIIVFTADKKDLLFHFRTGGTYYIYHPKLEVGNKATDWTLAPEDVDDEVNDVKDTAGQANAAASEALTRVNIAESLIKQLSDSISMLVTDANGGSLMTQTADGGWTFSMAQTQATIEELQSIMKDLENSLGSTDAVVETLTKSISDIESSLEWVRVTTYEDEPCIALGETDSDFKLLITNTRIMFMQGTDVPAYISNRALHITKAVIREEMQAGGFVIKRRTNGNLGWLWKGESD